MLDDGESQFTYRGTAITHRRCVTSNWKGACYLIS